MPYTIAATKVTISRDNKQLVTLVAAIVWHGSFVQSSPLGTNSFVHVYVLSVNFVFPKSMPYIYIIASTKVTISLDNN